MKLKIVLKLLGAIEYAIVSLPYTDRLSRIVDRIVVYRDKLKPGEVWKMNSEDYKKVILLQNKCVENGLFLATEGPYIFVCRELTNSVYKDLRFRDNERVSPPFDTIEECAAWVQGYLDYKLYLKREGEK